MNFAQFLFLGFENINTLTLENALSSHNQKCEAEPHNFDA